MNCREAVKDSMKRMDILCTPTGEFHTVNVTDCNSITNWVPRETMVTMRECGLLERISKTREKLTSEGMLYMKEALKNG